MNNLEDIINQILQDTESSVGGLEDVLDSTVSTDPESYTSYQQEVIDNLVVTNELLSRISVTGMFILAFLIFDFIYNLIRFNITNHFA